MRRVDSIWMENTNADLVIQPALNVWDPLRTSAIDALTGKKKFSITSMMIITLMTTMVHAEFALSTIDITMTALMRIIYTDVKLVMKAA